MEYINLNQQLVINPYPIYIKVKNIHRLEVFQYVTELDINIGQYTIYIFTRSQDMTIIVTEFGQSRYNRLLMVIGDNGYIFKDKLDKILGYIKVLKTYNDNILVLSKDGFLSI